MLPYYQSQCLHYRRTASWKGVLSRDLYRWRALTAITNLATYAASLACGGAKLGAPPPPELGLGEKPTARISIFMSLFDCHINRAPVAGRVTRIAYKPGLFLNADLDKASEDNERNGIVIETATGVLAVVQIAGLIARRIVCFVSEGASVSAGDRVGLIRFGSRVDVYLPDGAQVLVGVNSRAVAGETVIADLKRSESPWTFRQS